MSSKTLHLTLKKKWFNMIASGEKKEEYREMKLYWFSRLEDYDPVEPNGIIRFKCFTSVCAINGYGNHRPSITWKHEGIRIGTPNPEWCEPEDIGKTVFILDIGEITGHGNGRLPF